jgi:hypothetical protein
VGGAQTDANPSAEGMAEHNNRLGHLIEDWLHGGGVLGCAPCCRRGRGGAKARQVKGDGVEAVEQGVEVPVRPLPAVQREDPGPPLAVPDPE